MFKLMIQDDEGKTTVVPLIRDEITIGRKEGNTIRLTERNVSRKHARLLKSNGSIFIEDVSSYNGIKLNGDKIDGRASVGEGDRIQIGDYQLALKLDRAQAAAASGNGAVTAPGPVSDDKTTPYMKESGTPTQMIEAPTVQTPIVVPSTGRSDGRSDGSGLARLVVVSSNFAGQEFPLDKAAVVIGRTDENDVVVNHRSISRHHAKVVRENGHYHVVDLQSANGVRVNGEEYGKVELRRGDVVDLGHVRLRFIEPGEDFVFARDAVITDVPESGSKRGMLVAIILGVLVLGAAVAFIMTRNPGSPETPVAAIDAGSQTRVVVPEPDARVGNDVTTGDAAVAMVATADAAAAPNPATADIGATFLECKSFGGSKALWDKEISCANEKLRSLDAGQAKTLVDEATAERTAMGDADRLTAALKTKNLLQARNLLDQIGTSSQYTKGAQDAYDKAKAAAVDSAHNDVTRMAALHQCAELRRYLDNLDKKQGPDVTSGLRGTPCTAVIAIVDPPIDHTPAHPPGLGSAAVGVGSGSAVVVTPPQPACDADEHKRAGEAAGAKGQHAQALSEYEAALKCKPDPHFIQLAYMEACGSNKVDKAKQYFARIAPASQQSLLQICLRNGIEPRANPPK